MKYNNCYRNLNAKTVDYQSFWRFRRDYLNGMDGRQWCEWALELNKKVIRKIDNE